MISRRHFTAVLTTLAIGSALTVACGGCAKKSDEIQIGAFLSLSGSDSTFGTDARDGIALAVDEVNAAGGVKGKKIKVLYEDDKSTSQETSLKVRQLIDREKVVALLGGVTSSRSLIGGLIASTSYVPMVTPSATAVEVTRGREWVFRTCFTDDQQGQVAARFVWNDLKKKKVGVFYAAQDAAASGLARSFRDEMKKLGGQIAIDKTYPKGETSFTSALKELVAASPEIIFVPSYDKEMVQIAREAKQLGIAGSMFVGGDGWDSATVMDGAGAELEGAHFTNHYAPDVPWPRSKTFRAAFQSKYKREPSSRSAQGYDAARVLFDAVGRATEVTPDAIRKALGETKDFQGATGTTTIDKDRNASKPVVIVKIVDKKLTYVTQVMAQ